MNECARKVLKEHKPAIKANLHLDMAILDELEQTGILIENQIHTIRAEKTNDDRIDQLLFFLPRRGPDAFTKFVNAIRKNYDFLAKILEDALNKELDRTAELAYQRCPPLTKSSSDDRSSTTSEDVSMDSTDQPESPESKTFPSIEGLTVATINSRAPCSANIYKENHQQLKSQVNENLKEVEVTTTRTNNYTPRSHVYDNNQLPVPMQQYLDSMYTRLKTHMTSSSMRELSFSSPQPVTFQMVQELQEHMFTNHDKCYSILGGKNRSVSLLSLIISEKQSNKDLRNALKEKEDQRNKYAGNIVKLENKVRDKHAQTERLKKENNLLQKHVQEASAKVTELEEKIRDIQKENDTEKTEALDILEKSRKEVEEQNTKCQKLIDELEETRKQNALNEPVICQHCQKVIAHEQNSYKRQLKLLDRNSKRNTPPISAAVRQRDARRDSDASSLTEAEQKMLNNIKRQNNQKFTSNIYHSQTRLDINDANRLQSNSRPRYMEQVRRSRLGQPMPGVRQGATPAPSLSKTNMVTRSMDSVASQTPMPLSMPMKVTSKASEDPRRKFLGALQYARR